jgi:inhibitor of cysteine peptidase
MSAGWNRWRSRVARVLGALLALGAAPGCASSGAAHDEQVAPPPLVLGVNDEGRRIELIVGQQLQVRLPANPSTGFAWRVRHDAGGLVRQEGASYFTADPNPGGLVGSGGVEVFRFTVAGAGEDDLRFEYRRGFDASAAAGRVVTFRLSMR